MKYKLITLDLIDSDFKYIKNLKKKLYNTSNDPSFILFPALTILGQTDLNSFNNTNLIIKSPFIEFENKTTISNNSTYIKSINNNFIEDLKNQLNFNQKISINHKYLNIEISKNNLPIIHLGNKYKYDETVKKIIINDIRLKIIEVNIEANHITYNNISSIHLSLDKCF